MSGSSGTYGHHSSAPVVGGVAAAVAVEEAAVRLGREVPVRVRLVVGDAVRPAHVAGLADLVDLVVAARAAVGVLAARVGPDLAVVDPAGLLVDLDPERVAVTHRVDLGTCLAGDGGVLAAEPEQV